MYRNYIFLHLSPSLSYFLSSSLLPLISTSFSFYLCFSLFLYTYLSIFISGSTSLWFHWRLCLCMLEFLRVVCAQLPLAMLLMKLR